ncbi:MAG: hypothetical protein PUP92_10485 [Rhizonema sp. PD38]|nr:hypothetical protein [Rhizonema sp. PD38]
MTATAFSSSLVKVGKTFLAVDDKPQETTRDITFSEQSMHKRCVIKQLFAQHHTLHHFQKASEFHQESLRLAVILDFRLLILDEMRS